MPFSREKILHNCCQVALSKQVNYSKLKLAAHHLYSSAEYPHLSESLDNLITLNVNAQSFNLFRQSLAERSFAGINPDVARGARHVWVLESFVSQPVTCLLVS
jgi:hypothetical protein